MLKTVILDMDGTLLDTERVSIAAWQAAGRQLGYDVTADFIAGICGMTSADIDRCFLEHFGPDFPMDELRALRAQASEDFYKNNPIPVKPGAAELLSFLRERGLTVALASGTELERARENMEKAGLWGYIHTAVCGRMVPRGKPNPDIFLMVLERTQTPPEAALVVEDSENGARAGLAAGCRVIVVPDTREPSEELLPRLYRRCDTLFDVIVAVEELTSDD